MHQNKLKRFCLTVLSAFLLITLGGLTPAFAHDGEHDEVPMIVTGELTVLQADDFANHRSQITYLLEDSTLGKSFYLRFDKLPEARLQTGLKVKVHGVGKGNEITVSANGNNVEVLSVEPALVSGTQNTLVILLNFLDAQMECTASYVNGL